MRDTSSKDRTTAAEQARSLSDIRPAWGRDAARSTPTTPGTAGHQATPTPSLPRDEVKLTAGRPANPSRATPATPALPGSAMEEAHQLSVQLRELQTEYVVVC